MKKKPKNLFYWKYKWFSAESSEESNGTVDSVSSSTKTSRSKCVSAVKSSMESSSASVASSSLVSSAHAVAKKSSVSQYVKTDSTDASLKGNF